MPDYTVVDQTPGGHVYLDPGETKTVYFVIRNDGPGTWTRGGANPVRLGTSGPSPATYPSGDRNRPCGFYKAGNAGWLSNNRIEMQETSVGPGQTARFEFEVTGLKGAANPAAIHKEHFTPVIEGFAWMSPDPHAYFNIDMRPISTTVFPWQTKLGFHHQDPIIAGNRTTDTMKLGGGIPDGPYNYDDPDVCDRILELLWDAGINNLSIDHGGYDTFGFHAAQVLIDRMEANYPHMTFNFFMDNMEDWGQGQFDVLASFAGHPNQRYYDTKPLLLTFGNPPASDNQNRFTYVSCGAQDATTGWHFESWSPMNPVKGACGTMIARYDDRVTLGSVPPPPFGRPSTQIQTHDPNLTEGMFASQFNTVYNVWNDYQNNMRITFFNTADEGHERISIFLPHADINVNGATSPAVGDTQLYDQMAGYIAQMKGN